MVGLPFGSLGVGVRSFGFKTLRSVGFKVKELGKGGVDLSCSSKETQGFGGVPVTVKRCNVTGRSVLPLGGVAQVLFGIEKLHLSQTGLG